MSKVILLPPPPHPPRKLEDGLVEEDSNEFGLTEWQYNRLLDEIGEEVRAANASQTISPVNGGVTPPSDEDREILLTWIQSKMRAADPEALKEFCEHVKGVELE